MDFHEILNVGLSGPLVVHHVFIFKLDNKIINGGCFIIVYFFKIFTYVLILDRFHNSKWILITLIPCKFQLIALVWE